MIQVPVHAHAHAHGHAHAHPVHVHPKPEVIPVAPTPEVVEEPVEEALSEASLEVVGEVFHGDEEDPYVEYDVVVEESESSESSEHTHESVDHYAAAAPEESSEETVVELVQPDPSTAPKVVATKVGGRVYRPEHALVAHSAAYPRPAYHHHPVVAPIAPVLVHDHDSSDDEPNVTINIYNGNGATMGFGANLECVPRVGECRPQCPEVVYNEYDNSLWFTW